MIAAAMMKPAKKKIPVVKALTVLRKWQKQWETPIVTKLAEETRNPFKVLISTVLSARTKDETTREASSRLFCLADTPQKMLRLSPAAIRKAIYPVGFYKTKAKNLLALCKALLEKFGGQVPQTLEELVTLSGVGRKTANLVITLAFGKHGICVDTHVHRISNRWGLVKTRTPKETEFALYEILPRKYWIQYNDLLVSFGQNICRPISPRCSICRLEKFCPKFRVTARR